MLLPLLSLDDLILEKNSWLLKKYTLPLIFCKAIVENKFEKMHINPNRDCIDEDVDLGFSSSTMMILFPCKFV